MTKSRGIYKRHPYDRIMERSTTNPETGCIIWQGHANSGGYGEIYDYRERRYTLTHRLAYAHIKGPIPEGLTIDHLCRVRRCVNADHLEAVTIQENLARRPVATACKNGHDFTDANTYLYRGHRNCRTCVADASRRHHERKKSA